MAHRALFLLDWLFGDRPLTGYHVWTFVFVLFLFHLPFFWSGTWAMRAELQAADADQSEPVSVVVGNRASNASPSNSRGPI